MNPLTFGNYPYAMQSLVGNRLPKFSTEESTMLKGSFDFLGLNYYTSNYVVHAPESNIINVSYITDSQTNLTYERNGVPIGPKGASNWLYVYPRGIRDLLLYIKQNYGKPIIYITENGMDEISDATLSLEEALEDNRRVEYYFHHLNQLQRAIRDGVRVKGYFAWALMDNFEWNSGYTIRFGLNYVDYKDNLKRYPKLSVRWFRNFLRK